MKNMEQEKFKTHKLIGEIEKKKKLITVSLIEKYVKREMGNIDNKEEMFADVQKQVNTKFNASEMYGKIDTLMILRGHIEYLDQIINKKNITKILVSFFVAVLSIMFIVSQYNSTLEEGRKKFKQEKEDQIKRQHGSVNGAWAYMQIFVEQRLKSPKSADFPFGGGTYHTTDLGGGRYKINSYVDAENAFGANIRTHFNGVIKRKDGGWVLEYLNFERVKENYE